jgi:predicted ATPase
MFPISEKFGSSSGLDAAQEELEMLEGELSSIQELRFAFRRAASRLTEMAGQEYKSACLLRSQKK